MLNPKEMVQYLCMIVLMLTIPLKHLLKDTSFKMFLPLGVSIVLVDTYWAGNSEEIDDLYGQYILKVMKGK